MDHGTSADLAVRLGEERLDLRSLRAATMSLAMVMSLPMLWLCSHGYRGCGPFGRWSPDTNPAPFLERRRGARLDAGGIRQRMCFVAANLEVVRLAAEAGAGVWCRTKLAEGPGFVPVGDRLHLPPLPTIGYVIETSRRRWILWQSPLRVG